MVFKLAYRMTLLTVTLMAALPNMTRAAGEPPTTPKAEPPAEPPVPPLNETHRQFLSRVARRTLRDAVLDRGKYKPNYVPRALASLPAEVVVRLRQSGYLRGAGSAGPGPITEATRDACTVAYQSLGSDDQVGLDLINELLIEIEAVGPVEPINRELDWIQPRAVDPYIEPGIHGMVLAGPGGVRRFCPTELFTSDMILTDALTSLARHVCSDPSQVSKTRLLRFRTAHWYQPGPGRSVVSLRRGLTLVPPNAVSREGLDAAIARLAEYMAYRQKETGLFSYEYQPSHDAYSDEDNLVRQVGAVVAMAVHARYSGKQASLGAADLGIRYHLKGLTEIPDVDNAAFIATADGQNKLGVTALLALATAEHPDAASFEALRRKLINAMLWLQRPSGMFVTAFPPAIQINAQEYFPGEALLAMARAYEHEPSAAILEAFDRAINFYRGYFRGVSSPAFVPWQVQAYATMARQTKRKDYRNYVFELTDWLAARQLDKSNCRWPDLWGGIAAYQPGRAGVATASYLEGFADALALARAVGDDDRADRYEHTVRAAARFVMQLQVRPEEAYFIRSPQDAIGGIRAAPALDLLRIDHAQHALIALIKTRQALFPRSH